MGRRLLASVEELKRQKTLKFDYREEGISREGFLAWIDGQAVAYENVCRHIPVSLDYGDGKFLNPENTHFICQTHGATYEASTGRCIAGPCVGAFLKKLPVYLIDEKLWFDDPE